MRASSAPRIGSQSFTRSVQSRRKPGDLPWDSRPGCGPANQPVRSYGFMGLENMDLRSLLEPFDHTNRPVLGAGGQMGSVRAPGHRPDRLHGRRAGRRFPSAGELPDLGRAVQAGRCQLRAVGAPGQRPDQPELRGLSLRAIMSLEGKNFFAAWRGPRSGSCRRRRPTPAACRPGSRTPTSPARRVPATHSTPGRGSRSRSSRCRHGPPRPAGRPDPKRVNYDRHAVRAE